MANNDQWVRHLYWLSKRDLQKAESVLIQCGYKLSGALLTPCQALRSKGKKLVFVKPSIWSRICKRQGSWYAESEKNNMYLISSDHRLPKALEAHYDSSITLSGFSPDKFPTEEELSGVVETDEYQNNKPGKWEGIGIKDALMFKMLFTMTGFWGFGDNLKKYWLGHKANHANFLSKKITTTLDGEEVPYTLTCNAGVCSSCVEFFNVVASDSRKLASACPGAVTFGGARRDTYYDIRPAKA